MSLIRPTILTTVSKRYRISSCLKLLGRSDLVKLWMYVIFPVCNFSRLKYSVLCVNVINYLDKHDNDASNVFIHQQ